MDYRIAVDTGGTFTDVIVADSEGFVHLFKTPSTPDDYSRGVLDGVHEAAEAFGLTLREFLRRTSHFFHGSTVAVNAVLEGKVAKTGFVTTRGFRDILLLREGGKPNPFNLSTPYPKPYVPRYLSIEVTERVSPEGDVLQPLVDEDVREAIRQFKKYGVQAIGVCLLWSIANPAHEIRIGQIIREEWPEIPFTLSHQLNPIIREYRRASSAVIDASLKPLVREYLTRLEASLRENGFAGEFAVFSATGGLMPADEISSKPIFMLGSGPAVAPVAGKFLAEIEGLGTDILVGDVGGTSFDVSAVRDGQILIRRDVWIGSERLGHITGISAVDVRSIGSGGGSIARVDAGGLLKVGPRSAGAQPGPACYARGGTEATVTDAAAVLGFIDPDWFLGGKMKIDVGLARQAVQKLASRLGMSLEETASGILEVASTDMGTAILDITVNQGFDPRRSVFIGGGGAIGFTALPIARYVGVPRVLVPRVAGGFSAFGGLLSDMKAEFAASYFTDTTQINYERANFIVATLVKRADTFFRRLNAEGCIECWVDARYPFQVWELEVPLSRREITPEVVAEAVKRFHEIHERVFGVCEPGQYIEIVNWRVRAIVKGRPIRLPRANPESHRPDPHSVRPAYFRNAGGWVETPFFRGTSLRPGAYIEGPAVILEETSTLVVYPGWAVTVTPYGNYLADNGGKTPCSPDDISAMAYGTGHPSRSTSTK